MAAVIDRRFDNQSYPIGGMNSAPLAPGQVLGGGQTIVTDTYGGWMTRGARALVFGLLGFALVLGTFLPGIIMIGMNWNSDNDAGMNGACTNDLLRRTLFTCAFFIFHALLVIPMFIRGDHAHSVTVNNGYQGGLRSFWTTRLAHTAAVLQAVGNLIEIALLIWTAVQFWGYGGLSSSGSTCDNGYPQYHDYMWAMLIIGFTIATISLVTVHWQYTSAAIRYRLGGYAKGPGSLVAAP